MNTTAKGTKFEKKVLAYFSSLLENDELTFAQRKYSKIYHQKKYPTDTSREIIFDITIENYNPLVSSTDWSSLVVIECKNLNSTVNIGDFDEFRAKLKDISETGIKGIFVTTKGFPQSIIEKARKEHIALIVLSETNAEWIVGRDTNINPEQLMPILRGEKANGINPLVYDDGLFLNLYDFLKGIDVVIEETQFLEIPYYKSEEIQKIASNLHFECNVISNDIAGEILSKKFIDFRITFENLPENVLGLLSIQNKVITLSESIRTNINRLHFTIAHEIGHLVLHIPQIENKITEICEFEEQSLLKINSTTLKRMEWQANQFASFLLLPQGRFMTTFNKLLNDVNIRKGRLYLDHQPCNIRDVNYVLGELSRIFQVSKEVVKIRLKNAGLFEESNNRVKRFNEIFN